LRYIIYISIIAWCINCSSPYEYRSKGFFSENNYTGNEPIFSTYLPYEPNDVPKITEGEKVYYAWKTVAYNHKVDNSESETFPSYRTLKNSQINKLNAQEIQYLRSPNSLLINYLFFIDDYRFIYLSEDDNRDGNSLGQIPLYFDGEQYELGSQFGSVYDQLIRGYYHKKGNQIFLDFESEKHFYVKAHFDNKLTSIQFDSILVPKLDLIKTMGLHNNYVAFDDMLHKWAQPFFELPDTNNVIIDNAFLITTGFINHDDVELKKRNSLHKQILDSCENYHSMSGEQIDTIEYLFNKDNIPTKRRYTLKLDSNEVLMLQDTVIYQTKTISKTILEKLDNILTW